MTDFTSPPSLDVPDEPHGAAQPPATAPTRDRPSNRRWWALAALTLSFVAVGLDSYIVLTALPTFSASLHASTSQLQWITAAYTLAWAGLLLPIGRIGDRLGHRRVLMAGLGLFGAASVLTAELVHSAPALIASRAVMGAGAAVIMPMGLALIPALFPAEADRRRAVTVTTVGAVVAAPGGPLLGGWLLSTFDWGSIFLINGPIAALALAGVWRLAPDVRDPAARRLDRRGAVLSAAGIVGVVYAAIQQPDRGWNAEVCVSLAGGVVLLAAFVLWQRRSATPLIDLALLRNRLFTWGTIAFAAVSFVMTGILFVLTPFLQIVQDTTAQGTGVRLLPMIGAMLVAGAASEKLAERLGVRIVIPAGMLVSAAGAAVLGRAGADGGYGVVALALAVFGIGLGLSLPLAADSVLGTLAPHQAGMGNALSRALQSVSVALGTAVLGSLLNDTYRHAVRGDLHGLSAADQSTATASVAGAHQIAGALPRPADGALAHAADLAYTHGMTRAAVAGAVLLLIAAAACLFRLPDARRTSVDTPG